MKIFIRSIVSLFILFGSVTQAESVLSRTWDVVSNDAQEIYVVRLGHDSDRVLIGTEALLKTRDSYVRGTDRVALTSRIRHMALQGEISEKDYYTATRAIRSYFAGHVTEAGLSAMGTSRFGFDAMTGDLLIKSLQF